MKELKQSKSRTDPVSIRSYHKGVSYLIDELKTDNENMKALVNALSGLSEQIQETQRHLLNMNNNIVTIAAILSQSNSSVTDNTILGEIQNQISDIESKGKNQKDKVDTIEKHLKKLNKTPKKREPKLGLIE